MRSPKLAVALGAWIAAYGAVGTLAPWRSAFSSPLFVVPMALVAVSTGVCAWERAGRARRLLAGAPYRVDADRAQALPAPSALTRADVLRRAAAALRRAGYRVAVGDGEVRASRGVWGALGSPVFHWALVLLVAVVWLGRLTGTEGRMMLPVGETVRDEPSSYSGLRTGVLSGGTSNLYLTARDFDAATVIDGIDRGPSARIGLSDGERTLAERRVYPNSVLRLGSLSVHSDEAGYAPLLAVETTAGQVLSSMHGFIPFSKATSAVAGPGSVVLRAPEEGTVTIGFELPLRPTEATGPARPSSVVVRVRRGAEPTAPPVTLAEGERMPVAAGLWLRFAKKAMYVSVVVANDWTPPFLYVTFALAAIGLSVALLVPVRRVWVGASEGPDGVTVRVAARHSRRDVTFIPWVAGLIGDALSEPPKEGA